jgi:multidrug resistance protein
VENNLKTVRLTVFLIVLLDVMGLGLIIPGQPFLAQQFGADTATITQLSTVYSMMQFFLIPVWGSLSDRYGRRPILIVTLLLTMGGHLLFALSKNLAVLFFARALAGIGAANIATAQAVLSDTHGPAERSRAMALVGAAFGLGFVLGPALGGMLFQIDERAPAALAAFLALGNIGLVCARLRETRPATPAGGAHRVSLKALLTAEGSLRPLVMTTLCMMTAFALMEQSIGLFIKSVWVTTDGVAGMKDATQLTSNFLVVVGITAIFVQGFLVRRWLLTTRETTLLRRGLFVIACSLALIPCLGWFGNYALFLPAGALLALGSGMFTPSMAGLVSLACPPEKQGIGLAINQSAMALGRIIGPLFAGALFAYGRSTPFITGVVLTVVALGVSTRVRIVRPM